MTNDFDDIDQAAKTLRAVRDTLGLRAGALNDDIEVAKRKAMRGLRASVAAVTEAQSGLLATITASPQLFTKPRSIVLHGIKLGFAKGKGRIEWEDDAQVVKLVRKHLPRTVRCAGQDHRDTGQGRAQRLDSGRAQAHRRQRRRQRRRRIRKGHHRRGRQAGQGVAQGRGRRGRIMTSKQIAAGQVRSLRSIRKKLLNMAVEWADVDEYCITKLTELADHTEEVAVSLVPDEATS